ncbi:MAG: hypothetical protein PHQ12_03510 [Chthoniobacteraceae bacterium]|nr:hypothetical protein [Chthoniobacteraceae bacterium]
MEKPSQTSMAIALARIADSVAAFNNLPLIDPAQMSEGSRAGFRRSLECVHNNIHLALQRLESTEKPKI